MTEPERLDSDAPAPAGARLALALAVIELVAAGAAYTLSTLGLCPAQTGGLSCAALVRPAFSHYGPAPIAGIGVVGAALTVLLAALALRAELLQRSVWLARVVVGVPAAGAGFVLGLQALPIAAGSGVCPICLLVALSALATAIALAVAVGRVEPSGRSAFAAVFTTALLVVGGGAALQGTAQKALDAVARTELEQLTTPGRAGRRLMIVERQGCPYCEALRLDVLGRDPVLGLLREGDWRVVFVEEGAHGVTEHAGGRGAPVLIAFDPSGAKRLGRLRGYRGREAVAAWLRGLPE